MKQKRTADVDSIGGGARAETGGCPARLHLHSTPDGEARQLPQHGRMNGDGNGFVMTPLSVVAEFGLPTAAVLGLVYRYSRMRKGRCFASVGRMARELRIGRRTVERALARLCAGKGASGLTYLLKVNKGSNTGLAHEYMPTAVTQELFAKRRQTQNEVTPIAM